MSGQAVIDQNDVNEWIGRFKDVAAKPEIVTASAPPTAAPWHTSLFGCFDPIETCLMSCFCPCVVFSRTHHRLRKDPNLEGFSPINTTCLGVTAAGCVGLSWAFFLLQKADIRQKFNLEGNIVTDCVTMCCCGCCAIAQDDKEVAYRTLNSKVIAEEIKPAQGMEYPVAAPQ